MKKSFFIFSLFLFLFVVSSSSVEPSKVDADDAIVMANTITWVWDVNSEQAIGFLAIRRGEILSYSQVGIATVRSDNPKALIDKFVNKEDYLAWKERKILEGTYHPALERNSNY